MNDEDKCALTGRRCWRRDRQGDCCSGNPTLEDASRCIEDLNQQHEELCGELEAMDRWVEKLQGQLHNKAPSITSH